MRSAGDAVYVRTGDIAAEMTARNKRHPLWGNKAHWYAENEHDPGRTDWDFRAVDSAYESALAIWADTWLERVAVDSPYFERG